MKFKQFAFQDIETKLYYSSVMGQDGIVIVGPFDIRKSETRLQSLTLMRITLKKARKEIETYDSPLREAIPNLRIVKITTNIKVKIL